MNCRSIVFALCVAAPAVLCACVGAPANPNPRAAAPLALAPAVDLPRFMGRWYVIANIPYFAEAGYVGSYVEYAQRPDGDIDDLYFGRKGSFENPLEKKELKDSVVAGSNNAEWRASPVWPVSFSYLILYVDPAYQYALVGYPERKWGWVFARSPEIDDATYHRLLAEFDRQGYDTSRFLRVPQQIDQLGKPGFQSQ
ncbi:lipocalin family protein [Nevskia soli]|uniref:lipocalin family protein n=1 Tax=Nevskia soli TaxID=418856 RepID=UPI0004A744F2|nr:lipocalin family protein [Nevskia soli]